MHVLLIEDDPRIRDIVEKGLVARGLMVSLAKDGTSGADMARKLDIDLVLLDLVLPDIGGLEALAEIRSAKPRLPVIALTALDDTGSKIGGLDAGADDYVTKPFSIEELAARIRARLRWDGPQEDVLRAGELTLDQVGHRVFVHGNEVALSAREFSLLAAFMGHPRQVLARDQLLSMVWNMDFDPGSNVVDVHVAALRRKIGAHWVETVRGLGYRFVPDAPRDGDTNGG